MLKMILVLTMTAVKDFDSVIFATWGNYLQFTKTAASGFKWLMLL